MKQAKRAIKLSYLLCALCLFAVSTNTGFATEKGEAFYHSDFSTLVAKKRSSLNAFGGPSVKSVSIDGSVGIMLGVKGAWDLNESFSIGVAGYSLLSYAYDAEFMFKGEPSRLNAKYCGVDFIYEYEIAPQVHVVLNSLMGGGRLKYELKKKMSNKPSFGEDYFLFVEPGISLEMGLAEGIRFALGSSYRSAFDVGYYNLNNASLSGFTSSMYFKFKIF